VVLPTPVGVRRGRRRGRVGGRRAPHACGVSRRSRPRAGPFAARGGIRGADIGSSEAFCLVRTHETPGDPRVRALPSPAKQAFGWLAVSCEVRSIPCLAEWTSDGTETGHIRDPTGMEGVEGEDTSPRLMA
jgi:hypothetical protein